MLECATNQPSIFSTKNWIQTTDDARETYNRNSQIKYKTTVLKSSLSDYSDASIIVKEIIRFAANTDTAIDRNKK